MDGVKVERLLSAEQLDELGINRWAISTCPRSEFIWICDEPETSYIMEGRAKIITESGRTINLKPGRLLHCPAGSICSWIVLEDLKRRFIMG